MAIRVNSVVTKYKEKLAKTEAELAKERRKSKQLDRLKALAAGGVKLQPNKRAKITLTLTNCAEQFSTQNEFTLTSAPIAMAGFQWALVAQRSKELSIGWLGLDLCCYPPAYYKGPFEFEVNWSFRVLSV